MLGILWLGAVFVVVGAGCGGSGSKGARLGTGRAGGPITPGTSSITPIVVSSDLAKGPARFAFAILDSKDVPIQGEAVRVRILDPGGEAVADTEATWRELHHVEEQHSHEGGTADSLIRGVYTVQITFEAAGTWQAEVSARGVTATVRFDVAGQSQTPAIGQEAPAVDNPVLPKANIQEIDSSDPPHPELHQTTIAEAVRSGRPAVIVFATPAFCQSRVCGPVLDEVLDTYPRFSDRVAYVHVEPYKLTPEGQPVGAPGGGLQTVEAVERYGLPTEPWVFVVDARGKIAAKFEGTVTADEVAAAIEAVLG